MSISFCEELHVSTYGRHDMNNHAEHVILICIMMALTDSTCTYIIHDFNIIKHHLDVLHRSGLHYFSLEHKQ